MVRNFSVFPFINLIHLYAHSTCATVNQPNVSNVNPIFLYTSKSTALDKIYTAFVSGFVASNTNLNLPNDDAYKKALG